MNTNCQAIPAPNPWSQSTNLPEGLDARTVRRARIIRASCPSCLHGEKKNAREWQLTTNGQQWTRMLLLFGLVEKEKLCVLCASAGGIPAITPLLLW
jgi:hypothetical protein